MSTWTVTPAALDPTETWPRRLSTGHLWIKGPDDAPFRVPAELSNRVELLLPDTVSASYFNRTANTGARLQWAASACFAAREAIYNGHEGSSDVAAEQTLREILTALTALVINRTFRVNPVRILAYRESMLLACALRHLHLARPCGLARGH